MPKRSLGKTAFVLICALTISLVLVLIAFFSLVVGEEIENRARITVSFYLGQLADSTEGMLDAVRTVLWSTIGNANLQEPMRRDAPMTQMDRLEVEDELNRSLLYNTAWDNGGISGIFLVKSAGGHFLIAHTGDYGPTERRMQRAYELFSGSNSTTTILCLPGDDEHAYMVVDYVDLVTMKQVGKLIVEIDSAKLLPTQSLHAIFPGAEAVLRGESGEVIRREGDAAGWDWEQTQAGQKLRRGDETYYIDRQPLAKTDAQIAIRLSQREMLGSARYVAAVFIGFSVLALFVALVVGALIYRRLTRPLSALIESIDRVAEGDLMVQMPGTAYRETEIIAAAFNTMVLRLQHLFAENYEKAILLKESEFAGLTAQIDPHFIFNVLEVINLRCMEAGREDICRIVGNLASLLRSNIQRSDEQKATVASELELARFYLELQKERFGPQLQYAIDVEDESLLQCLIPRLSIEPLVENSVQHGLENKKGAGKVRIGVWEESEGVCICVSDDGVGLDMDKVKGQERQRQLEGAHNHIALSNIERRIELLYGPAYGMRIESALGVGTTVRIVVPCERDGEPAREEEG